MSHTHGPWIREEARLHGEYFNIRSDTDRYIADVRTFADANLVAAAPDLLLACDELVREADDGDITANSVDLARYAIAKAKGQGHARENT